MTRVSIFKVLVPTIVSCNMMLLLLFIRRRGGPSLSILRGGNAFSISQTKKERGARAGRRMTEQFTLYNFLLVRRVVLLTVWREGMPSQCLKKKERGGPACASRQTNDKDSLSQKSEGLSVVT